jgi:hypothetical protein
MRLPRYRPAMTIRLLQQKEYMSIRQTKYIVIVFNPYRMTKTSATRYESSAATTFMPNSFYSLLLDLFRVGCVCKTTHH